MVEVLVEFPDELTENEIGEILTRARNLPADLQTRQDNEIISSLIELTTDLRNRIQSLELRESKIEIDRHAIMEQVQDLRASLGELADKEQTLKAELVAIAEETDLGQIRAKISTLTMRASKLAKGLQVRDKRIAKLERKIDQL